MNTILTLKHSKGFMMNCSMTQSNPKRLIGEQILL